MQLFLDIRSRKQKNFFIKADNEYSEIWKKDKQNIIKLRVFMETLRSVVLNQWRWGDRIGA